MRKNKGMGFLGWVLGGALIFLIAWLTQSVGAQGTVLW